MDKDKCKRILKELQLYPNEIEMYLKTLVWLVSWIMGVLLVVVQSDSDHIYVGSAFFLYTIALLIDVIPKRNKLEEQISIVVHTIFCATISTVFLISFCVLLGAIDLKPGKIIMNIGTVSILIYLIVNFFITWISKNENKNNNSQENSQEKSDTVEVITISPKKVIFETNLFSGNMGVVGTEEKTNE